MGSKARNVLMGIAGGMQGFQQAAKLEQQEEELKLKKKFMEQQMEVYKDKLVESGTKRENTTKFRLMLKEKRDRGEKITPEDLGQYLEVDEGARFYKDLFEAESKREAEASKLQFGPAGSVGFVGKTPMFQLPEKTTTPKIGTDREAVRMELQQTLGREPTMAEVNTLHQKRAVETAGQKFNITIPGRVEVAGAGPAAAAAATPPAPSIQKDMLATEQILSDVNNAIVSFSADFLGPARGRLGGLKETFGETPLIGKFVGGPASAKESSFRQAVGRVRNAIRNKEFGAALTAFEAAEADKALIRLEQSPKTGKQRLEGLQRIFTGALERSRKLAITPKSQLQPTQPGGVLQFNPATGKIE